MPVNFVRRSLVGIVASLVITAAAPARAQEEAPVVAVASSMQFAMAEISDAFTGETGRTVRLSFGSSGNFNRQIREGAPFEVFIAADETNVLSLHRDGFAADAGQVYAVGRLVLVVPQGSTLAPDGTLDALETALANGAIRRFAIASPEHAPYGMRAQEALTHRGLWGDLQPFLVIGENITQAAQFALSGNAEGGITAYSLVLSADMKDLGRWDLIPQDWHQPLSQRMVLLKNAGETAQAFYAFMATDRVGEIMARYGFTLPQE